MADSGPVLIVDDQAPSSGACAWSSTRTPGSTSSAKPRAGEEAGRAGRTARARPRSTVHQPAGDQRHRGEPPHHPPPHPGTEGDAPPPDQEADLPADAVARRGPRRAQGAVGPRRPRRLERPKGLTLAAGPPPPPPPRSTPRAGYGRRSGCRARRRTRPGECPPMAPTRLRLMSLPLHRWCAPVLHVEPSAVVDHVEAAHLPLRDDARRDPAPARLARVRASSTKKQTPASSVCVQATHAVARPPSATSTPSTLPAERFRKTVVR